MAVAIRYFASLRERVGRAEQRVNLPGPATVAEVWTLANPGVELPANVLAARNQARVAFDEAVQDGDEVAFFPPVTGG